MLWCTSFRSPPVYHHPYEVESGEWPQRRKHEVHQQDNTADSCTARRMLGSEKMSWISSAALLEILHLSWGADEKNLPMKRKLSTH